MIYKYVGIAIIFISSVCTSYACTNYSKTKLKINEAILEFIEYIKMQILFFHKPLNDIYDSYENKYLQNCGFLQQLSDNDWQSAINTSKINMYLSNEVKETLYKFGAQLGKSGTEEQINNCDYCIASLDELYKKTSDEIIKKSKVYSSLTVIGGIMVAIILF